MWRALGLVYERLERNVDAIFCYEQAIDDDGGPFSPTLDTWLPPFFFNPDRVPAVVGPLWSSCFPPFPPTRPFPPTHIPPTLPPTHDPRRFLEHG